MQTERREQLAVTAFSHESIDGLDRSTFATRQEWLVDRGLTSLVRMTVEERRHTRGLAAVIHDVTVDRFDVGVNAIDASRATSSSAQAGRLRVWFSF